MGLALVPAGLGAAILLSPSGRVLFTDSPDGFSGWVLLALFGGAVLWLLPPMSGPTGGPMNEPPSSRIIRRIAEVIMSGALVAFILFVIVAGLFAPQLIVDPRAGGGRAPDDAFEALMLAIIMIATIVGVAVTVLVERRKRRRGWRR